MVYAAQRHSFKDDLTKVNSNLNQPYNYRVINDYVNELLKSDKENAKERIENKKPKKVGKNKWGITKEILEEYEQKGTRNIDIAQELGVLPCVISRLKKQFGLKVTEYKKKK